MTVNNFVACAKFKESLDIGRDLLWATRTHLPAKAHNSDFGVWSFVKQCIGKDLTKISMPVTLNEPLSFLQRLAECMEYAELLTEALDQNDPIHRMEYICAFAVSATSSNHNRLGKPFNPLLGETYEFHHDRFIFIAEQVSHHPPVTAFHVESEDYRLTATVHFKLRFWGKSIDVQPKGVFTLVFHHTGDVYTWQNPNLTVNNVLMGKMSIEHTGTLTVTGVNSGLSAQIHFRSSNHVSGQLLSSNGCAVSQLFGNWTRGLFSVDVVTWNNRDTCSVGSNRTGFTPVGYNHATSASCLDAVIPDINEFGFHVALPNQRCLWLARSRPSYSEDYFNFTLFTIGLNELTADLIAQKFSTKDELPMSFLPPTDSRFRPDIRALESSDLDTAASEKFRLEEKQRDTRKQLVLNGCTPGRLSLPRSTASSSNGTVNPVTVVVGPMWFALEMNPVTGQEEWLFTGDYWSRGWQHCPEIY